MGPVHCLHCVALFIPRNKNQNYCSQSECRLKGEKGGEFFNCHVQNDITPQVIFDILPIAAIKKSFF